MVNALDQVPEVPEGPKDQEDALAAMKDSMEDLSEVSKELKKMEGKKVGKEVTTDVTKGKLHLMQDVVKKLTDGTGLKYVDAHDQVAEEHAQEEGTQSVPAAAFTSEAETSVFEPQRGEKKSGNELWTWLKKALGIKNTASGIDAGKKQAKPKPIEEADAFEAKEEVVDGKKPTNEDKDEKVMVADEASSVETPLLNPIDAPSIKRESRPETSTHMAA